MANKEPLCEKTYLLTCTLNEDSDQLAFLSSLNNVFSVRLKPFGILSYPQCALRSDCADAQAGLSPRWANMYFGRKRYESAQIISARPSDVARIGGVYTVYVRRNARFIFFILLSKRRLV